MGASTKAAIKRLDVLGFRVRAQQLDRERGTVANTAILDIGVQDTGPDGARWALAVRGVNPAKLGASLSYVWSIRGAPHAYRSRDLPAVAAAVAPYSDVDAGKRIFNASKPLKAAGIGNLAALDTVADAMRAIVTRPTGKGEVSTRFAKAMDEPYLRYCRACQATHLYEMPFRLAALRAGIRLQPDTSPPVLERIPGFAVADRPDLGFAAADRPDPRFDVIRAFLRLLGPATPKQVAEYLDAPVTEVTARWPQDVTEVSVAGERRFVLEADAGSLHSGPASGTRLLGPYDLYLQLRDRASLVDDEAHRKALWPMIGRPGAILHDSELAGLWRPRKSGATLGLRVELWSPDRPALRKVIEREAERLAAFRGVALGTVEYV